MRLLVSVSHSVRCGIVSALCLLRVVGPIYQWLLDGNNCVSPHSLRSQTASLPCLFAFSAKTSHHNEGFLPPSLTGRIAFFPSHRRPHPTPPPAVRRWRAANTSPGGNRATHMVASCEVPQPRGRRQGTAPHPPRDRAAGESSRCRPPWNSMMTSSLKSQTCHRALKQALMLPRTKGMVREPQHRALVTR